MGRRSSFHPTGKRFSASDIVRLLRDSTDRREDNKPGLAHSIAQILLRMPDRTSRPIPPHWFPTVTWQFSAQLVTDFLALSEDADPDIPISKQAKAEYAKLQ